MKKILILVYHLDQGGVEKASVEFANNLVERGYDVDLVALYKFRPDRFDIDSRVRIKSIFNKYFKGLDRIVAKVGFLQNKIIKNLPETYDIAIAFQAGLPHEIVLRLNSKLKYTWIHGIGFELNKSYLDFNRIFFVGKDLKEYYQELYPEYMNRSYTVYNCYNKDDIISKSKENLSVNYKKMVENTVKVVSVGRLSQEKKFNRLIEAVSILNKKGLDTSLTLVGEGPLKSDLEKQISELKIENKVILTGFDKNP